MFGLYNVNLPAIVLFGGGFGVTPARKHISVDFMHLLFQHSVLYLLLLWEYLAHRGEHGSRIGRI